MGITYDAQDSEYKAMLADPSRRGRLESWLLDDRLDSWRHQRMYAALDPLIDGATDKSWLTIGDGRYGTDARALLARGVGAVHASDLSTTLLDIAGKAGVIRGFSQENAEALSFADGSFDYVYCKEACHHFPRPYLAIYEMLRVCSRAVVLTEPNEPLMSLSPIALLRRLRGIDGNSFEPVGNYVYTFSAREFEKLALGLGCAVYAFKGLNDYYVEGIEEVPLEGGSAADRAVRRKVKTQIAVRDFLSRIGLMPVGLLTTILFKSAPDERLMSKLTASGYTVRRLPKNPYAKPGAHPHPTV